MNEPAFEERYREWARRSGELFTEASRYIPGGAGSSARTVKFGWKPYPPFMTEGLGSRLRDVDGHEYVDYLLGLGPMILGHRHPAVTQAVTRAVSELGTCFGLPYELEIEAARKVTEAVPGVDLVRFSNSGSEVVDRHHGRVFADEIHGPLVYPGMRHIPYASTSEAAASHALTATSASKAWNLPGLKCAQVILTNEPDRQRWEEMGFFASHGASNPGVVANIAAFRHGEAWLDEVLGYLEDGRHLLAGLLLRHLPQVRFRPPDGTYLAWLDCTAMDLPDSPGVLVTDRARVTVVDGPAFGAGGPGAFRFNFATPHPILTEMVERIAAALTSV